MKQLLRQQALLILFGGLIFLTGLGQFALLNDGESKTAATAAEMTRHGAWIVPTFNDQLQIETPILIDWLLIPTIQLMGPTEFAVRLLPALLAIATSLLTYHLGRKLYFSEAGFLAAIILQTSLFYAVAGRAATEDSLLTFLLTLSLTGYVWLSTNQRGASFHRRLLPVRNDEDDTESVDSPSDRSNIVKPSLVARFFASRWFIPIVVFAPLGLGILTSGPVALLLPGLGLFLFVLISQRVDSVKASEQGDFTGPNWKWWLIEISQTFRPRSFIRAAVELKLIFGILIAAAVSLPWYLAVGTATGGKWWTGFFIQHNLSPIMEAAAGHDGFPFFVAYQLIIVQLGIFPWTTFLAIAVTRLSDRLRNGAPWRDSDRLLACWAGVWFLAYSLIATRVPDSLLPIYPVIALILGRYLSDWQREKLSVGVYSFIVACRVLIAISVLLALGLSIFSYLYFPSEQWIGLIAFVPVIAGIVCLRLIDVDRRHQAVVMLISTAWIFTFLLVTIGSLRIRAHQDTPLFLAEARKAAGTEQVTIGTYQYFQPGVVFYAGSKVQSLRSPREVADFIANHPKSFVILPTKQFDELRDVLPINSIPVSRHKNFLHGHELMLLGN